MIPQTHYSLFFISFTTWSLYCFHSSIDLSTDTNSFGNELALIIQYYCSNETKIDIKQVFGVEVFDLRKTLRINLKNRPNCARCTFWTILLQNPSVNQESEYSNAEIRLYIPNHNHFVSNLRKSGTGCNHS